MQLSLGQAAEEVPREGGELVEELGERALVFFELTATALELDELALNRDRALARCAGRRAEAEDQGNQEPGGNDQADQERNECTRHGVFPS
jgi:hypothetical protein